MYKEEQDILHITEDIEKLELRRKRLIQQRAKKEKQVAEKRRKAEAAWQKKLSAELSKLLAEAFGETYWETVQPEQVLLTIRDGIDEINTINTKEDTADEDQS